MSHSSFPSPSSSIEPTASRRLVVCGLAEVAIYASDYGRRLGLGSVVDLDEVIAPGVTMEAALGRFRSAFYPLNQDPISAPNPPSGTPEDSFSE